MDAEPTRDAIDSAPGPVLLEFGASWCPHCQAIAHEVAELLGKYPDVRHVKVEDGPGKPLGRSFRVKLWPTFVFLRDGREVAKEVRPSAGAVRKGLDAISEETGHALSP